MRVIYDNFLARFGLPKQLHSDMGKDFESHLFKELCELVGTYKSHSSAFHPQSDGQCERINRSLLQSLRATAQDNPESWPQRLPTLMAAYRITTHKAMGMTPNFAMLGREVTLPAFLIAKSPQEPLEAIVPFCCQFSRYYQRCPYKTPHICLQFAVAAQIN